MNKLPNPTPEVIEEEAVVSFLQYYVYRIIQYNSEGYIGTIKLPNGTSWKIDLTRCHKTT